MPVGVMMVSGMLWVGLAGGIRVEVDGVVVDDGLLGGRQGRKLLARLAWEGRSVHRDELADGIWLDSLPRTWERTLSGVITRLRAGLTGAGVRGDVITFVDGSYLLVGGGDLRVDVRDAGCELNAAREAADRGDFQMARERAEAVLEVCRLPLLPGDDAGWVDVARARHRALLLGALDLLADVGVRAGWYALAEAAGREAVHCEPLREAGHQRLLRVLTAQGDFAAVMSSYAACRRLLSEELGVGPSPATERIYREALDTEPDDPVFTTSAAGVDIMGGAAQFPLTLAEHARALIGRESELVWLWSLWRGARVEAPLTVRLHGPAGSGKRSLAAVFAREVHAGGATVAHRRVNFHGADQSHQVARDEASSASLVVLELLADAAVAPFVHGAALVLVVSSKSVDDSSCDAALNVGPLDRAAVAGIVDERLGRAPTGDELDELCESTGGWPGALHERLTRLTEHRARRLAGQVTQANASLSSIQAELADEIVRNRRRPIVTSKMAERAPYKGLLRFEPEDSDLFVGREQLVADVLARLWADRLVVVLGASGSGKSSVMRAGVIAELRRGALPGSARWPVVLLTPGHHPLDSLTSCLQAATGSASESPGLLTAELHRICPSVVVVDQLEELFTVGISESERVEFLQVLLAGVADGSDGRVVAIVLRADFFDELSALLGAFDVEVGAPVIVGRPTELELRRIVSLPARAAGGVVEPGLVDEVVADARSAPGALPLVSTALLEAWNRRVGSMVTIDAYRAAGGVAGAIAHLAEGVWSSFDPVEQRLARSMLLRLCGGATTDYSNPVQLDELAPPAEPTGLRVLDRLVVRRLVTVDDDTVRLAHESLPREWPRFQSWLADDRVVRDGFQHLRRASTEWERRGREVADLYRGTRLAVALEVAEEVELSAAERTFLNASVVHQRIELHSVKRRGRRRRLLAVALPALLAVAAIAGVTAVARQREAAGQARAAIAQRLTRAAESADGLDLRLLLAVEARRLEDSPEARGALLGQLGGAGAVVGFLRGEAETLSAAALSPDGRLLATGGTDGSVSVWRLPEAELVDATAAPTGGPITVLAFASDGGELAAGTGDGEVTRWTPGTSGVARFGAHTGSVLAVAYRRDGDLVTAGADGLLRSFSRTTGHESWSTTLPDAAVTAAFDRNGTRYAQIAEDGELTVLDVDESGGHAHAAPVDPSPIVGPVALAVSPDGRTLGIGDESGRLHALDLETGDVADLGTLAVAADRPEGSMNGVDELVFVDSGELLATGGGVIVRFDIAAGHAAGAVQFVGGRVTGLTVDPRGETATAVTETGDTILLDLDRSSLARPLSNAGQPVTALAVAADATVMAAGDGQVALLDLASGRRQVIPVLGHPVTSVSTSGGLLATGGRNVFRGEGSSHGAYTVTMIETRQLVVDADWWFAVTAIAVQPGGSLMAFGDDRGQVRLVELNPTRRIREIPSLPAAVAAVGFRAGGDELVGVATDGTMVRWDLHGQPIGEPVDLGSPATALAITPDGATAAVATTAGAIVVDLATGSVSSSLTSPYGRVDTVSFGLDGTVVATGGSGGVLLWDVASGRRLGDRLPAPDNTAIAFDATGRNLITGGADGEVVVWEVDPDRWVQIACQLAGRTITRDEWHRYLGERSYDPACR